MKIFVCTRCVGKKACTLFFPDDERKGMPTMCGPDEEGYVRLSHWMEAPGEFTKVLFH